MPVWKIESLFFIAQSGSFSPLPVKTQTIVELFGTSFLILSKPATFGNGTQITLLADSKEAVEKFYEIAISKGAADEGGPGVRSDGNYYAYVRDLDGNKIAAKSDLK